MESAFGGFGTSGLGLRLFNILITCGPTLKTRNTKKDYASSEFKELAAVKWRIDLVGVDSKYRVAIDLTEHNGGAVPHINVCG